MNQPIPTGPDRFAFAEDFALKAKHEDGFDSDKHRYFWHAADFSSRQAQTAAIVMLTEVIAAATGTDHYDLDAWREKIGVTWLKECRGKETRRPACEERHTEDCAYADPPPSPEPAKREPTGLRVYVEHRLGGTQGHIVAMVPLEGANDGTAVPEVQWYQPGARPVREKTGNLLFITADHVERCLNGQTRDECTEIDPCEACQQDIDAEGDVIEESMGL